MPEADYNVDQASYQGPGRYRHYKGGEYHVLGLALQEDTVTKRGTDGVIEQIGQGHDEMTFVIYAPASPGSLLEERPEDFWARELGDFNEMVLPRNPVSDEDQFKPVEQTPSIIDDRPLPVPRFVKIS